MWPRLFELTRDLDQAEEAEREAAFQEITALARKQPEAFASAVKEGPLGQGSLLFWIYEAIARDSEGWDSFIGSEVSRVLLAMPEGRSAFPFYLTLGGFAPLRSASARHAVTAAALVHSESPSWSVRLAVANIIGDFAEPENQRAGSVLREYCRDPNWRVRVEAAQILNEDDGRPHLEGIRLLDRLRAKYARPTW